MLRNILFLFVLIPAFTLAEAPSPGLPQALVAHLQLQQVFEYTCPPGQVCQVHCRAGEGHSSFEYQQVKRLELGEGLASWLAGAVYLDATGKGHAVTAILPVPVSCVLDDLVFTREIPVIDGVLQRPDDSDVIFDLQPQH